MDNVDSLDLNNVLAGIKPSLVTPHLNDVTGVSNDKKVRVVANLIMTQMAKNYNDDPNEKVPTMVLHDGQAVEVRYLNVEPLLSGVWPSMSLMLLQLSFGEQTTLIEALYPKNCQFAAKAFAAIFTKAPTDTTKPLVVKQDDHVEGKLDSANAGIAMILAMLQSQGYLSPHADRIREQEDNMAKLVMDAENEKRFREASKRAKDAQAAQDR